MQTMVKMREAWANIVVCAHVCECMHVCMCVNDDGLLCCTQESGGYQTTGVDMLVTGERVVLLDTQVSPYQNSPQQRLTLVSSTQ